MGIQYHDYILNRINEKSISASISTFLPKNTNLHPPKMVSSQQGYIPTVVDMKADPKQVDEVKSNLPLPEQPPVASDFNSADARTVNVGAGGLEGDISASGHGNETLREPATGDVGAAGIPNDAVSREAKKSKGLVDTTNPDKGTPPS